MGSKNGGGGGGKKDTDVVQVALTVGVCKALLSALTSQVLPDRATAQIVTLALVKAIASGGGGGGKGKKGKGRPGGGATNVAQGGAKTP